MALPVAPQQLADLVQQEQAAEAARLEDATAAKADGGSSAALATAMAAALAGWVTSFGGLAAAGAGPRLALYLARVRGDASRATTGLGPRASQVIAAALADATRLGTRHALAFGRRAGARWAPVGVDAPVAADALHAARALADTIREQLALMERLLSPASVQGTGWRGVVLGLAAGRRAVTLVRSAVAWCIHRAINSGAAQVVTELAARALWVSEPDACVRCLAYAGRMANTSGEFPGGLSMDPAARSTLLAAIDGPPLHAHCRCRLVPWREEWARPGQPSLPDLLREQAIRSVAAGTARPSESIAARIRAVRALLAQRGLPADVRRQARAAAAAGHF